MKKLILLALVLSISFVFNKSYASEVFGGEPEKVTMTATACAAGTWTKLLNSDHGTASATFWRRIFMSERSQTYQFRYTFNNLTYTVVDDYTTVPASTRESWKISVPNGVYVSPTWTAGAAITIEMTTTK